MGQVLCAVARVKREGYVLELVHELFELCPLLLDLSFHVGLEKGRFNLLPFHVQQLQPQHALRPSFDLIPL